MRYAISLQKTWLVLFAICLFTIGCGPAETKPALPTPASAPASTPAETPDEKDTADDEDTAATETKLVEETQSASSGGADLSGRVTLKGKIPPPRKLSITKDAETCGAVDTIQDIEGTDGGVANVVIEVKGVKGDDWTFKNPADGYVLRQKDCQFQPNLVVIPVGQDISVYNDDPVGHNVNTGDWNQMQPAGKTPIVKPVENKAPTKIGCNIHSWMEAWIYPVQNPYFAVTDAKGNFKIEGVPPGKYRVNIWHAALGRKTARLTLESGKPAKLDHEYEVK